MKRISIISLLIGFLLFAAGVIAGYFEFANEIYYILSIIFIIVGITTIIVKNHPFLWAADFLILYFSIASYILFGVMFISLVFALFFVILLISLLRKKSM